MATFRRPPARQTLVTAIAVYTNMITEVLKWFYCCRYGRRFGGGDTKLLSSSMMLLTLSFRPLYWLDNMYIAFQSHQVHGLLLLFVYGLSLVRWRRTMFCFRSETIATSLYVYMWLKCNVSLTLSDQLWICAFHKQHNCRSR